MSSQEGADSANAYAWASLVRQRRRLPASSPRFLQKNFKTLAIAESFKVEDGFSVLAGVVARRDGTVEAVAVDTATVGGTDATEAAVRIAERLLKPDVSIIMEQRETYPVQLPEGFYARVKLTVHVLNKRGDSKGARAVAQDLRELLIERVRKIAVLVATKPDVVSDQGFLERLTPEEKALLNSMYVSISSFIAAVMP